MKKFKCFKCSNRATVTLKYPRINLCTNHFNEFFIKRVKKTIEKYRMLNLSEKIGVAVSGGKDSVALLVVLTKILETDNINCIHIDLGISDYSSKCRETVMKLCDELNISCKIVDLKKCYGFTLDDLVKRKIIKRAPCSICGMIKRRVLNDIGIEIGVDKIVTGHNLDDEVTFLLQNLVGGNIDLLIRSGPIIEKKYGKLIARAKPLYEISEYETLIYCKVNDLRYVEIECPYAKNAPTIQLKKKINEIEEIRPGFKLSLLKNFRRKILPLIIKSYKVKEEEVKFCKICGYPTTSEICAFCRLRMRVKKEFKL